MHSQRAATPNPAADTAARGALREPTRSAIAWYPTGGAGAVPDEEGFIPWGRGVR